ncbi:hypothetical protein DFJ73DRAFT_817274 [Zopfochytrium polystomum]|nr:hypothetical protein DFJ73DRAFT_817274 [Zopfochytrium polystomum]
MAINLDLLSVVLTTTPLQHDRSHLSIADWASLRATCRLLRSSLGRIPGEPDTILSLDNLSWPSAISPIDPARGVWVLTRTSNIGVCDFKNHFLVNGESIATGDGGLLGLAGCGYSLFRISHIPSRDKMNRDGLNVCVWVDSKSDWVSGQMRLAKSGCLGIIGNFPWKIHSVALSPNINCRWGDGGELTLKYPVRYAPELDVPDSLRLRLVETALAIDATVQDVQQNGVARDIIDPDLFPNYFLDGRSGMIRRVHERMNKLNFDNGGIGGESRKGHIRSELNAGRIPTVLLPRESYHWIPSDVEVSPQGKVRFLSPIHNLPQRFSQMENDVATLFERMLPLFDDSIFPGRSNHQRLQVIVKLQMYEIPPHSTYTGKWHLEGQTENITAAGVYFLQVDDGLRGGHLKFRPRFLPDHEIEYRTRVVPVVQGTAVCFRNTLPHRLAKITNPTAATLRRLFINFFVVDPACPLPSTTTVSAPSSASLQEAKDKRADARAAMAEAVSGWGFIHWGNVGNLEYLDEWTRLGYENDHRVKPETMSES